MPGKQKRDIVQIRNPIANRYVKVDRDKGMVISYKESEGPYKGVPVVPKSSKK